MNITVEPHDLVQLYSWRGTYKILAIHRECFAVRIKGVKTYMGYHQIKHINKT
jgi:hypothetical protein